MSRRMRWVVLCVVAVLALAAVAVLVAPADVQPTGQVWWCAATGEVRDRPGGGHVDGRSVAMTTMPHSGTTAPYPALFDRPSWTTRVLAAILRRPIGRSGIVCVTAETRVDADGRKWERLVPAEF